MKSYGMDRQNVGDSMNNNLCTSIINKSKWRWKLTKY